MGQPSKSELHVDQVITQVAIAYLQSQDSFLAPKVFPVVPVTKQSDKYRIWTKNDWFRDEARLRAPATESAGGGYNLSTGTYSCDVYAFHQDLADQIRANADADVDLDQGAMEFVMQRLLLRREIQWVTDFFATSKWATDKTVAAQWSDYAASDPVSDIEEGKSAILTATGYEPNTLVLGYDVWRHLKNHPDIVARLGLGGAAADARVVTRQAVAAIFELGNVYVAKAVKATNAEGATAAYALTHGKHALLAYVSPTPSTEQPSAGYTFGWKGLNGNGTVVTMSRFRIESLKAERIEGEMAWDNVVTGSDLGYFFSSVVA